MDWVRHRYCWVLPLPACRYPTWELLMFADLIASFNEAVREWKRRRWLRRQRASIHLPF
jgi:hypothetical protein